MKRCPECSATYSDSEGFCSSDGAALVPADSQERATVQMTPEQMAPSDGPEAPTECPVCGGKALPGEEVCSFCGSRLGVSEPPPSAPQPAFTPPGQTVRTLPPDAAMPQQTFDDEPLDRGEEPSAFRRLLTWTGYIVAACVALAAGAWFALHLSSTGTGGKPAPTAVSSPAAPTVSGPIAALATNTPIQITGESASDPARNAEAARKVFTDNSAAVIDAYSRALAGDDSFHDGLVATLTVNPAGDVVAGTIRTSTSPNPAVDGDLINTMMGWHFEPFGGSSVEVTYPVVMARNPEEKAAVESMLANKIAHLNTAETPEYASAPAPAPATPAVEASPALAAREPVAPALPPPPARREAPRERRRREAPAVAPRPPRVALLTRVQDRMRIDRRFNRVKAYTAGSVVTLYGKVFDDKEKRLAVAAARKVDGVTDVIDNLQTDTAMWAQQQALVNQQLQAAGLSKVTAKVIGHDAYLDGQVSTEAEKEHAVTVAESAAPVRVRTNLIRVVPKGVFGF
jgi:BON domain